MSERAHNFPPRSSLLPPFLTHTLSAPPPPPNTTIGCFPFPILYYPIILRATECIGFALQTTITNPFQSYITLRAVKCLNTVI
jgi:hypothetical protein